MAAFKERIERLEQLAALIPVQARSEDCPDAGQLLERLGKHYDQGANPTSLKSRRRTIQRDLEELVEDGLIDAVNPGGKPLRFRRSKGKPEADPYLWDYARAAMRTLIKESLPTRQLEPVWRHLLDDRSDLGLGEGKLRIVTDTQRLLLAEIRDQVLTDVLEALALSRVLKVGYRDAKGKFTKPVLHPQALLQRGPRVYLFALKNDELEQVQMYALHRFTRSFLGEDQARVAKGFDLQAMIDRGQADFGDGKEIALVLRARDYVCELLRDCPLAKAQRIEDEDDGSPFEIRVHATVPSTGQLFRWLLGFGDKVEVIEPLKLREAVAAQMAKAAALYQDQGSAVQQTGAIAVTRGA